MWRADAGRTSYTAEELPDSLELSWREQRFHAPRPAWPNRPRLAFDRTDQPVAAAGRLFLGSSADDKVTALDLRTNKTLWTFFTEGPVRFAPAVCGDRLLVASDDGHLYCLSTDAGQLLWKLRGGPRDRRLLGNGRMISRWPARGGPVVVDGVVYFAAGIWPSEGIYVYAVDVASGKVLWCNDDSGTIEMPKPRGGTAHSGIAAQGHLAVGGDTLIVPTGRGAPAAFDRRTGKLLYFRHAENKANGGSDLAVIGPFCVFRNNYPSVGQRLAALADGVGVGGLSGTLVAADPTRIFYVDRGQRIIGRYRSGGTTTAVDARGNEVQRPTPGEECLRVDAAHTVDASLAVAGGRIIAGGDGQVSMIDIASKETLFTAELDGEPYGLAIDQGRLIVSTDTGWIYCFAAASDRPMVSWGHKKKIDPAAADSPFALAAEEIVQTTSVRRGFCLDLGCGDGRLAIELARRTELQILAVDADPGMVEAARKRLDRAGLYGVRVAVHLANTADAPYADRCADLVVSGRSVTEGPETIDPQVVQQMMSPYLGHACLGKPGAMEARQRGPLSGAGNWTHFYTDAGNRFCADDTALHGPLEALWYRDTDWPMPSRHAMDPASLVYDGRFIMIGVDGLRVLNAYNGRTIWQHRMEGLLDGYSTGYNKRRRSIGGNACVGDDRVYVRYANRCLCLDVADGRELGTWSAPEPGWWGYLAYSDGLLVGSLAEADHRVEGFSDEPMLSRLYTESKRLFAMDAQTGKVIWQYKPYDAVHNNAIAVGAGRVYLIDRPLAKQDDVRFDPGGALEARARREAEAKGTRWQDEYARLTVQPPGRLFALDLRTGKTLWEVDEVTGSLLALSAEHNALVVGNEASTGLIADRAGPLTVYRPADGEKLWETGAGSRRPILNGRQIVFEGRTYDLLTGESSSYELRKSFTCGPMIASTNLLVFRSATLGYYDFSGNRKVENYGGIRPGCWVDAVPAGGLVLLSDGAAQCGCSYLNQATIALQPRAAK